VLAIQLIILVTLLLTAFGYRRRGPPRHLERERQDPSSPASGKEPSGGYRPT
jgi:hypothetical protein